jgi:GATA-binding protein
LWKYVLSNYSTRLLKQNNTNNTASNAPSGIAQLRKSSDQVPINIANTRQVDHLDKTSLDDFISSDNISTPTGISILRSLEPSKKEAEKSTRFTSSAITIKICKSPTDLSPQVLTVNKVDPETNLYSLDQAYPPGMIQYNFTRIPFQLDILNPEHNPTITYQQNFPLSPSHPPYVQHGPFSAVYNNAGMPSSLLNSNDRYSPLVITYLSAVSTPQLIPEKQDVYFQQHGIDMPHQRPHTFSHVPSSLSKGSTFTAMMEGGQSNPATIPASFGMTQDIEPLQVFQSDHPAWLPGVLMFSFGADFDGDKEEGDAFADRRMKYEFTPSPTEDPSMEMEPSGLQCDASLMGQFDTQAAHYSDGPPGLPTQDEVQQALDTVLQYSLQAPLADQNEFLTLVKLAGRLRGRSCSGSALQKGLHGISEQNC